jgi:hypothetical protein
MSLATAKELLEAIVAYNRVKDGDSGDAERDAGGEMQAAAITHLRDEAGRSVELAELIDNFGDTLDEYVEEEE